MINYLKNHWIKIGIIFLIFIVSLGRFQHKMPKRNFADFHVDYYTGQKMLKGEKISQENSGLSVREWEELVKLLKQTVNYN